MSKYGETAKKYFEEGYNCSQAVALAFKDEYDIDEKTMLMLSSTFGGGMGRMREVCGTVSGALIVLGLKRGYSESDNLENKKNTYSLVQEFGKRFKEENGSIICRELLGLEKSSKPSPVPTERTDEFYKKRPCGELVKISADILADMLYGE